MSKLKPWLVVSREYGEVVPVLDDGTGPMEYGSDYVFVEAATKRDALMLGVYLFQQQDARYLRHFEDESPYVGVKVESQICTKHGMPTWDAREQCYRCLSCEHDEELRSLKGYTDEEKARI